MMDESGFRKYMKENRRSASATDRCVDYVGVFEGYLADLCPSKGIEDVTENDLEQFVTWSKAKDANTKTFLWALTHYFTYLSAEELAKKASQLRQNEIKHQPLPLKEIRNLGRDALDKLSSVGIQNISDLLEAAKTPQSRTELAMASNVPQDEILEIAKLADLCRIPGVKGIRARLFYDAGVDTLEKMALWDPKELREMLVEFVERTGFDGIAPWQKEAQFSVDTARKLPKMLEL